MKLSEAIMLGSTTCRLEPMNLNHCALGCAANAMGMPKHEPFTKRAWDRVNAIHKEWPWIIRSPGGVREEYGFQITRMFDGEVCLGFKTLEQLVDWVRSVEPDCGECNRFDCTCTKTTTETTQECLQAK